MGYHGQGLGHMVVLKQLRLKLKIAATTHCDTTAEQHPGHLLQKLPWPLMGAGVDLLLDPTHVMGVSSCLLLLLLPELHCTNGALWRDWWLYLQVPQKLRLCLA